MTKEENDKKMTKRIYVEKEREVEQKHILHPRESKYMMLNPESVKEEVEEQMYKKMVKSAVRLNEMFLNVTEMTDEICIATQPRRPGGDMRVDNTGTWVTCLFDNVQV